MGKHSTERKYKKKINCFKFIVSIIILAIIVEIVLFLKNKEDSQIEAKDIINTTFLALKEADIEKAKNYLDYEKLINSLDQMILEDESKLANQIEKMLFSVMSWNIQDVKYQDGKEIATVEVTNKNYKNIISNWMKEIVSQKAVGKEITNELALEKLKFTIENETEKQTIIKQITLTKIDDMWKIVVNDDLRDLVFPGIDSIVTALKQYET